MSKEMKIGAIIALVLLVIVCVAYILVGPNPDNGFRCH